MPLPDLHRHLDGSLRPDTLAELAARQGHTVPPDLRFTPNLGLEAALARFAFTLSLLQHPPEVRRVADEICQDAAADDVTTLEIRFAPHLHAGSPIPAIVDAALEGIDGRAGLILCALYGDPPDLVHTLVDTAHTRPGVVGLDLAGGPSPTHDFGLADYQDPFQRAADLGLGRTVHAGEGRPPAEIRAAIETLGAQRIGHGTTLLQDPDVLALVRERGITIEACPTSNVHTGVIPSVEHHPLCTWLDRGVQVCVNTDNTLLSDVQASQEHQRITRIPGFTDDHLQRLIAAGHRAAFAR